MRVKLLKTDPCAVLPFKTYEDDFCYDLTAIREEEIAPNVWKYYFGFAMQMDTQGMLNSSVRYAINFLPRSSVWEHGMLLSNCEGVIDAGFTKEVSAIFYHIFPNMPRYRVGERVVQMKIGSTVACRFDWVENLDKTARGDNGYGSTGQK